MLVLFETSAGYAIFKVKNEKKLEEATDLYKEFQDPESACNLIKLEKFAKFEDTREALAATTDIIDGKVSKKLKKLLKKLYVKDMNSEILAVADKKLSAEINSKFNIPVSFDSKVQQLMRGIRSQLPSLLPGLPESDLSRMTLGLAHSLNRYKLKCNPDKIDTMIVQAISLLDDLDKEANNYIMRCKEMYGWHFPELAKVVTDNIAYIKLVDKIGMRENATSLDMTDIISEELVDQVRDASIISLGTELTEEDVVMLRSLCAQVMDISESRAKLYEYLKQRMAAVAPNLTILVGELLGARLIAHAGTLVSLAKHPSSTVQILGAEKALFRALKTKHQTPKYGLLYHASLVGQASTKIKGKMSRMLAAKASLAIRMDALGEEMDNEMGLQFRTMLEKRLKDLESGAYTSRVSGIKGRDSFQQSKFGGRERFDTSGQYDSGKDMSFTGAKKRKFDQDEDENGAPEEEDTTQTKRLKMENEKEEEEAPKKSPKKQKTPKKAKIEEMETKEETTEEDTESSKKKKKKKKKSKSKDEEESD